MQLSNTRDTTKGIGIVDPYLNKLTVNFEASLQPFDHMSDTNSHVTVVFLQHDVGSVPLSYTIPILGAINTAAFKLLSIRCSELNNKYEYSERMTLTVVCM